MFNGIIFNQGLITKFEKRSKGINIFVKADLKLTRKESSAASDVYKRQTIKSLVFLMN